MRPSPRIASPGKPQSGPEAAPKARERIFAVAKDLFYRRGIRAVGVETIVTQAGVTKMSLYRSFPSKDDLVVAYLRERDAKYWDWWNALMDRHAGDPRAQIRALFESVAKKTADRDYRGCPFTNAATEFPDPENPGREVAAENKRELRVRLRGLAAAAGAKDPARLGDQLFLLIEGAYASGQIMGPEGPMCHLPAAAEALLDAAMK